VWGDPSQSAFLLSSLRGSVAPSPLACKFTAGGNLGRPRALLFACPHTSNNPVKYTDPSGHGSCTGYSCCYIPITPPSGGGTGGNGGSGGGGNSNPYSGNNETNSGESNRPSYAEPYFTSYWKDGLNPYQRVYSGDYIPTGFIGTDSTINGLKPLVAPLYIPIIIFALGSLFEDGTIPPSVEENTNFDELSPLIEDTEAESVPGFLEDPSQMGHIFRNSPGHLAEDTPENRALLVDTVKEDYFRNVNEFGNEIYTRLIEDGREVWVFVRDGIIRNGGINNK
jgi:hypothetical protein